MTFCTAINCMDGRTQVPVTSYLRERFDCAYVDTVTEAGPNRIIADNRDKPIIESILQRVRISVEKHASKGIAVVGHADCAGNPTSDDEQHIHITAAVAFIRAQFPSLPVIGLWVNDRWEVNEIAIN